VFPWTLASAAVDTHGRVFDCGLVGLVCGPDGLRMVTLLPRHSQGVKTLAAFIGGQLPKPFSAQNRRCCQGSKPVWRR
jgi:hypothetical protein